MPHEPVPPLTTRGIRVEGRVRSVDILENAISLGRLQAILFGTLEAAALRPGDRLLDVGCGSGRIVVAAADRLAQMATSARGPGAAVGIDATIGMVRLATERARAAGSTARFAAAIAEALPFADRQFAAVTSTFFFHHLPTPAKRMALAEMLRVLEPGGRLVVADYGRPRGVLGQLAALPMRANVFEHVRPQLDGELERLLGELGLGAAEVVRRFLGYITVLRVRAPPLAARSRPA